MRTFVSFCAVAPLRISPRSSCSLTLRLSLNLSSKTLTTCSTPVRFPIYSPLKRRSLSMMNFKIEQRLQVFHRHVRLFTPTSSSSVVRICISCWLFRLSVILSVSDAVNSPLSSTVRLLTGITPGLKRLCSLWPTASTRRRLTSLRFATILMFSQSALFNYILPLGRRPGTITMNCAETTM